MHAGDHYASPIADMDFVRDRRDDSDAVVDWRAERRVAAFTCVASTAFVLTCALWYLVQVVSSAP